MSATYLHVFPILRIGGVLSLLPLYAYMARRGTTSNFTFSDVLKFNFEPRQTDTKILIGFVLEH